MVAAHATWLLRQKSKEQKLRRRKKLPGLLLHVWTPHLLLQILARSNSTHKSHTQTLMKTPAFEKFVLIFCLLQWASAAQPPTNQIAFPRKPQKDFCSHHKLAISPRPHSVAITDFGGVGDGITLNTYAFESAISYLSSFANKGGGELYVPAGKWLTGSFNLTSHLTLFLDKDAVLLGSQDTNVWPVIAPLPSYGRGRELPGLRYSSLIFGHNLTDVIITGDNGTIDGQGESWWHLHRNNKLNYTRGPLLELMDSKNILIANLTFKNSPFWNIHPVYCRKVLIQNVTILAPRESPNTDGIDPDSSSEMCIEDCYISMGDDLISIKSGWDEYGIAYGRPSSHIMIRRIVGDTRASAGIAIGSEMSGGVSDVFVYDLDVSHAGTGIRVKSAAGRGGYVKDVYISKVKIRNTKVAIGFTGFYGEHPDPNYNESAIPDIRRIVIDDVVGDNITLAGNFQGLPQSPYHDICLTNIHLNVTSSHLKWNCSYVQGYTESVHPEPCAELRSKGQRNHQFCRFDDKSDAGLSLGYPLHE